MDYKQWLWTKLGSTKPKNHGELKFGLNKTKMTLMMTIIKMSSALSWTTAKWCTHVDWTMSSTWDISKYHTTISTINIQINLLKTRRMEYCMCRICRQGIDGHTWFRQVDQPSINQILYGMSECRAIICCMSLSLMKWTILMWAEMRRNRKRQGAWCQRNNQTNIFELLKSSSQSHAQWSELPRGPFCIWSRWWMSSGSRMWRSWLHASMSNVRLLNINRLILILWMRKMSYDCKRPVRRVMRGPLILIANSINLSKPTRWSNQLLPFTVRKRSSIYP